MARRTIHTRARAMKKMMRSPKKMVRIPKKMGLLSPKTETKSPETETKVLLVGQRAATKKQPYTRAKQGMSTSQVVCLRFVCPNSEFQ